MPALAPHRQEGQKTTRHKHKNGKGQHTVDDCFFAEVHYLDGGKNKKTNTQQVGRGI